MAIDVVIPAHEKDADTLRHCVRSLRRHMAARGRIFVISRTPMRPGTWVPEPAEMGGQSREALGACFATHGHPRERSGWLYQQILKLGADLLIADLSESFLICDADVIWLRAFAPSGAFELCAARSSAEASGRLHERFWGEPPPLGFSTIRHQAVWTRTVLSAFRDAVEARHPRPWARALADHVDFESAAPWFSEYDLLSNFAAKHFAGSCRDVVYDRAGIDHIPGWLGRRRLARSLDYVTAHSWQRNRAMDRLATRLWRRIRRAPDMLSPHSRAGGPSST